MSGILQGDSLAVLKALESESVQCIVTSPPYYGLRSYGCEGEIGQEQTLQEFLSRLVEVFRECRRVLKDDGVCWVNMGDSYASGKGTCFNAGGGASSLQNGKADHYPKNRGSKTSLAREGLKPKDRMMVPARLAIALQDDGWWLRDEIVWHKPNPMPSSVQDRTTPAHEMIYLLTKSAKYYYNAAAIRTDIMPSSVAAAGKVKFGGNKGCDDNPTYSGNEWAPKIRAHKNLCDKGLTVHGMHQKRAEGLGEPETIGANCRSVWTFSTQGFVGAHFATFPEELPTRCILAGSREGDTVLDPFTGSGTTLAVAVRLGRVPLGIELNPEYIQLAQERIAKETPSLFAGVE